jgi:light-regulated signal transduction histidine kinase (bacteriophytochrome)
MPQDLIKKYISATLHNIKTPLTTVLGYSELLKMKVTDEKEKKWIGDIHKEALQMQEILHDFRLISNLGEIFASTNLTSELNIKEIVENSLIQFSEKEQSRVILNLENDFIVNVNEKKIFILIESLMRQIFREVLQGTKIEIHIIGKKKLFFGYQIEEESVFSDIDFYKEKHVGIFVIEKLCKENDIKIETNHEKRNLELNLEFRAVNI